MNPNSERRAHIAIVGGGFTGMTCALTLLQAGYHVTVLESASNIGGLAVTQDFGAFKWDRFYHCILTSDTTLLRLLQFIGLGEELRWTSTNVGFFSHGQLHRMTSPRDLLRFPHLSIFDKLRLGLATVYAARFCNGKGLEHIKLDDWTRRLFGDRVYREIWEPLFCCKLGEMRHKACAAFLWGTLRRLYSTRESGPSKQEHLGYVRGGYATVFARMVERVREAGAEVRTNSRIQNICTAQNRSGSSDSMVELSGVAGSEQFDGVILTVPNQAVASCLCSPHDEYLIQLRQVHYLGLVCVALVLRRQLSPYYVTNITEKSSFTGIIEMTNLIDREVETAGLHLVYLPRYTNSDDPLFAASDIEVWQCFEPDLMRIHPDLKPEDIADYFVFRERAVQPVPTMDYSAILPPVRTPLRGVYLANTSQIQNNTLNNNVMADIADTACSELMKDIAPILHSDGDMNYIHSTRNSNHSNVTTGASC